MRYSYQVSAGALACAASVIGCTVALHLYRMHRGRRFCPGPRSSWYAFLSPLRLFILPGCGYNLSGLPIAPCGSLTCPECGRKLRDITQARTHPSRFRWHRPALIAIAVAWFLALTDSARTGQWSTHAPDWLVIAHRVVLGKHGIPSLNQRADHRLSTRIFSPTQLDWIIPSYIDDLRNDEIPWNADNAIAHLTRIGLPAVPRLNVALDSSDYQQRQLAAHILRQILDNTAFQGFIPSDRLLAITAEGLRSDTLPFDPGDDTRPAHGLYVNNAREGMDFLAHFPLRAQPDLLRAMRSSDQQARFLAAVIATQSDPPVLLSDAAPILISHLKDNAIGEDAKFAASALKAAGPIAIPYLQSAAHSTDDQQRNTALLVLLDLITEPTEAESLRRPLQHISSIYFDPPRLTPADINTYAPFPDFPATALTSDLAPR